MAPLLPTASPVAIPTLFGQASGWIQQVSRGATVDHTQASENGGAGGKAGPRPPTESTDEAANGKRAFPKKNPFLAAKRILKFPDGGQVSATYTDDLRVEEEELKGQKLNPVQKQRQQIKREQLRNIRSLMEEQRYRANRPWIVNMESSSYNRTLTFVYVDPTGISRGLAIVAPDRRAFNIPYIVGSDRGVWHLYEAITHQAKSKGRKTKVSIDLDEFVELRELEEKIVRARIDRAAQVYKPYSIGSHSTQPVSAEDIETLLVQRDEAFTASFPRRIENVLTKLRPMAKGDPERGSQLRLLGHLWDRYDNRLAHQQFLYALSDAGMKLDKGKVVQLDGSEPTAGQLSALTENLRGLAETEDFYQALDGTLKALGIEVDEEPSRANEVPVPKDRAQQ